MCVPGLALLITPAQEVADTDARPVVGPCEPWYERVGLAIRCMSRSPVSKSKAALNPSNPLRFMSALVVAFLAAAGDAPHMA